MLEDQLSYFGPINKHQESVRESLQVSVQRRPLVPVYMVHWTVTLSLTLDAISSVTTTVRVPYRTRPPCPLFLP